MKKPLLSLRTGSDAGLQQLSPPAGSAARKETGFEIAKVH